MDWSEVCSRLEAVTLSSTATVLAKQSKSWEAERETVMCLLEARILEYPKLMTQHKADQVAKLQGLMTRIHGNCSELAKVRIAKEQNLANKAVIEEAAQTADARYRKIFNDAFQIEVLHSEHLAETERDKAREVERRLRDAMEAGMPVGGAAARDEVMRL